MREILDFCTDQHDWLIETMEALVRLESPTTDKAAVDRCGRELEGRLRALGGRVTRIPQTAVGDHVRAEFGRGDEQILLLGHLDTVWPVGQIARMPLTRRDGCLYGPGIYDMKAGIAQAMLATWAIHETGVALRHRTVMLWTSDEETGSGTSRQAVEREAQQSAAVLVLEPALHGSLKTSRKGCGMYEVTVTGVSAHAGVEPGQGASAIQELAHQILALGELQDLDRGISVNVGVIAGGTRINVVPERATAGVDVRVPTMDAAIRLDAAIRRLAPRDVRTRLEVTGGVDRPPMERGPAVQALFAIAREVAADLGRELTETGTGGGSDGNFTAAIGVPTLDGLGAAGDGAHALHEHVILEELPWRAALLAGLVSRIRPTRETR